MTAVTQPMRALERANEIRSTCSQVKHELRLGELSLHEALFDERAASCRVYDVLRCRRGVGVRKARRALASAQISENRRCRDLSERQKVLVLSVLR
jgi:hypothetical protein